MGQRQTRAEEKAEEDHRKGAKDAEKTRMKDELGPWILSRVIGRWSLNIASGSYGRMA